MGQEQGWIMNTDYKTRCQIYISYSTTVTTNEAVSGETSS
jgi:hypothetical protein